MCSLRGDIHGVGTTVQGDPASDFVVGPGGAEVAAEGEAFSFEDGLHGTGGTLGACCFLASSGGCGVWWHFGR